MTSACRPFSRPFFFEEPPLPHQVTGMARIDAGLVTFGGRLWPPTHDGRNEKDRPRAGPVLFRFVSD